MSKESYFQSKRLSIKTSNASRGDWWQPASQYARAAPAGLDVLHRQLLCEKLFFRVLFYFDEIKESNLVNRGEQTHGIVKKVLKNRGKVEAE